MVELSNAVEERTAPPTRLAAPREEVRDALLTAAGQLIYRFGYRKTSVDDIAREAGVSRATAYLYFANKESIAMAWIERKDRRLLDTLRKIAESRTGAAERIEAVLLARILIRFDDAQVYRQSAPGLQSLEELLAALRGPILDSRERQHEAEAMIVAESLRTGIDSGELRNPSFASEEPEANESITTARSLILGTNALLPYSLTYRQFGARDEVETKARALIHLLLAGLRAAPVPMTDDSHETRTTK